MLCFRGRPSVEFVFSRPTVRMVRDGDGSEVMVQPGRSGRGHAEVDAMRAMGYRVVQVPDGGDARGWPEFDAR